MIFLKLSDIININLFKLCILLKKFNAQIKTSNLQSLCDCRELRTLINKILLNCTMNFIEVYCTFLTIDIYKDISLSRYYNHKELSFEYPLAFLMYIYIYIYIYIVRKIQGYFFIM